jgi:hypothetical protein
MPGLMSKAKFSSEYGENPYTSGTICVWTEAATSPNTYLNVHICVTRICDIRVIDML